MVAGHELVLICIFRFDMIRVTWLTHDFYFSDLTGIFTLNFKKMVLFICEVYEPGAVCVMGHVLN